MSNIYAIFAAVHFILINCKVFYRCNGSNNLLKIQFMFEMQTIFLAKLTLVVGIWQYVAISGHSGLDSHHFQYTQNAHTDTCEHSLYLGK